MRRWTNEEKLEFLEDTKEHSRVYIEEKWGLPRERVGNYRKVFARQLGIKLEPKSKSHTDQEKREFLEDCSSKSYDYVARKWHIARNTVAVYKRKYCNDLGIEFIPKDKYMYTKEEMAQFIEECNIYKYKEVAERWGLSVKCVGIYKREFSSRLGLEFKSKKPRKIKRDTKAENDVAIL